jgi:hypothetical protein
MLGWMSNFKLHVFRLDEFSPFMSRRIIFMVDHFDDFFIEAPYDSVLLGVEF